MSFAISSSGNFHLFEDIEELYESARLDFRGKTIALSFEIEGKPVSNDVYVDSQGQFWADGSKSRAYDMTKFKSSGLTLEEL